MYLFFCNLSRILFSKRCHNFPCTGIPPILFEKPASRFNNNLNFYNDTNPNSYLKNSLSRSMNTLCLRKSSYRCWGFFSDTLFFNNRVPPPPLASCFKSSTEQQKTNINCIFEKSMLEIEYCQLPRTCSIDKAECSSNALQWTYPLHMLDHTWVADADMSTMIEIEEKELSR